MYFHPRDKDGRLVAPKAPEPAAAVEDRLAEAAAAMALLDVPEAKRGQVLAAIRAAHGKGG